MEQARTLSKSSYKPAPPVPERMADLTFEQWRWIVHTRAHALWPDSNFQVTFFPAGYLFEHPVKIYLVEDGKARHFGFDPSLFQYNPDKIGGPLPAHNGYAGFRLLYPLNRPETHDEVASFLGASYFRMLGAGEAYGLSARGLAIDTGEKSGEEFPVFRAFWLVRPPADAIQMTLYALLDSESMTGAYRFVIHPGDNTVSEVTATLFARKQVKTLGLAPLTSMYFHGYGDHKPERAAFPGAHDSGGLLIHSASGEWIWRGLTNPPVVWIDHFSLPQLRGFGLMQRDRVAEHYAPGQRYAQRPSAWIEPKGDWGPGNVELMQFPIPNETVDNTVAFWVPDQPLTPGQSRRLSYTITWQGGQPIRSPLGRVLHTFVGTEPEGARMFWIDFAGGPLAGLPADAAIEPMVTVQGGTIVKQSLSRNDKIDGWRLAVHVLAKDPDQRPLLRVRLAHDGKVVTETWDRIVFPR
ncbi:MAG: glucan biosynthesis protein [Salinisphaera sp.]|nr:glucan biosynthesis protein [Salinisphaera sp.]